MGTMIELLQRRPDDPKLSDISFRVFLHEVWITLEKNNEKEKGEGELWDCASIESIKIELSNECFSNSIEIFNGITRTELSTS